jgi:hypothetical protein
MADQFTGKNMVLEFGTVDVSASMRKVTITENADPPEDIDVTHKGDTERQLLDGLPGAVKTTVAADALDETGQASEIANLSINSLDTLIFYPEGKVNGKAKMTLNSATFRNRVHTTPYDGAVELSATFDSKQACTWSTYAT